MDQQLPPGPGAADVVHGLKRRARLIVVFALAGSLFAVLVAWVLPPVYTAKATILVESQQIPSELARSTVTASAAERLAVIEQRLMTRETLLSVARDLDLFADRPDLTPTERIEAMRKATEIVPITLDDRRSPAGVVAAFTIGYTAHRAAQAAAVANEFVTRILEQNLQQRSARAAETNEFFKKELDRLQASLSDVSQQIARFKTENAAALPDSLSFRRDELADTERRLFDRSQRRIELEEQRGQLQEALDNGLPLADRELTPEERELEQLRRTLTQQQAVMAPSHPQIRALKARIAALEGSVQPAAVRSDGESGPEAARSAAERRVQRQIELIDSQLGFLDKGSEADRARIEALKESIARSPAVEMALAELERRFSDLEKQRDVAVVKQAEAATGERLEVNRQAERFEVIEQAEAPDEPEAPNRPLIAFGGSAASVVLGFALALGLTMIDRTIRTPSDLERRLQLHPVITVPYIVTRDEVRRRRRRAVIGTAGVLLGVLLVLGLADRYVKPLPLLAQKIVTETGLDDFLWTLEQRLGF